MPSRYPTLVVGIGATGTALAETVEELVTRRWPAGSGMAFCTIAPDDTAAEIDAAILTALAALARPPSRRPPAEAPRPRRHATEDGCPPSVAILVAAGVGEDLGSHTVAGAAARSRELVAQRLGATPLAAALLLLPDELGDLDARTRTWAGRTLRGLERAAADLDCGCFLLAARSADGWRMAEPAHRTAFAAELVVALALAGPEDGRSTAGDAVDFRAAGLASQALDRASVEAALVEAIVRRDLAAVLEPGSAHEAAAAAPETTGLIGSIGVAAEGLLPPGDADLRWIEPSAEVLQRATVELTDATSEGLERLADRRGALDTAADALGWASADAALDRARSLLAAAEAGALPSAAAVFDASVAACDAAREAAAAEADAAWRRLEALDGRLNRLASQIEACSTRVHDATTASPLRLVFDPVRLVRALRAWRRRVGMLGEYRATWNDKAACVRTVVCRDLAVRACDRLAGRLAPYHARLAALRAVIEAAAALDAPSTDVHQPSPGNDATPLAADTLVRAALSAAPAGISWTASESAPLLHWWFSTPDPATLRLECRRAAAGWLPMSGLRTATVADALPAFGPERAGWLAALRAEAVPHLTWDALRLPPAERRQLAVEHHLFGHALGMADALMDDATPGWHACHETADPDRVTALTVVRGLTLAAVVHWILTDDEAPDTAAPTKHKESARVA